MTSKNVYDETDYEQLLKQIEEKIGSIQENDKFFDESLKRQLKLKENECERKKE